MPTLYMMVGLPRSGKSTCAEKISAQTGAVIFASDKIRMELFGSESAQTKPQDVFNLLHKRVKQALLDGRDVIYDATNVSYKRRMGFLRELKNIDCYKVCVLCVRPYNECLKRNSEAERQVPPEVIERMYRKFWVPQFYEGWDRIIIELYTNGHYSIPPLFTEGNADSEIPLNDISQDSRHHKYTIGHHCHTCVSLLKTDYPEASHELLTAALLHDIGKAFTKSFVDCHGEPVEDAHYYNHHNVSAYMSLYYTSPEIEDVLKITNLIQWHMKPFEIEKSEKPEKTEKRFRQLVGEEVYADIMRLHKADVAAKGITN